MRGGKRKGAGAPRKAVKKRSVVVRVPIEVHGQVMALVKEYNDSTKADGVHGVNGPIQQNNNIQTKTTTKQEAKHKNLEEKEPILKYKCGCLLDDGIFRRGSRCKVERSKHPATGIKSQ